MAGIKEDKGIEMVVALNLDGFISYEMNGGKAYIHLFHKGMSAHLNGHFKVINRKEVLIALKEFLLTASNIIVAGAAIYAIMKNTEETKSIRTELKEAQEQQATLQIQLQTLQKENDSNNRLLYQMQTTLADTSNRKTSLSK